MNLETLHHPRNGYRVSEAVPEPVLRQLAALFREQADALLREHSSMNPLMGVKDVARTFSVSVRTVETMIAGGELPQPLWIGGQRRYHPDTIAAYLRSREEVAR